MHGRPARWTATVGFLLAGAWVAAANPALLKPDSLNARAPDTFRSDFETSKGRFVIEVTRAWAPRGADRFYNLVKSGYYDNVRFFRVVPGFVVQFGIHGDPAVSTAWKAKKIQDDPVQASNTTGHVTFAMGGPNTRTTQIFINLQNNAALDAQGFAPIGRVVEGMEVVGSLHSEYGESLTELQPQIFREGNLFLAQRAPKLDFIKKASIATATPPKP